MVGGKRGDRRDDDAVARATNKQRPIAVPHVGVDLAPGLNICFDSSSSLRNYGCFHPCYCPTAQSDQAYPMAYDAEDCLCFA